MNLTQSLAVVVRGQTLSRDESRALVGELLERDVDSMTLAALLAALATRGEDADEIAGAAQALREHMRAFEHDHRDAIDTCGTGGDGLSMFNVSTAAAVVAAAAGARVIKHGNRSMSSRSGSADMLVAAGMPLDLTPEGSRRLLDELGITFLFAPHYHPLLAKLAPVRKALGFRTLFNLLGPLCNPGRVRRQVVGVPAASLVDPMAGALTQLGVEAAFVVHGHGAADELTLCGPNQARAIGRVQSVCLDAQTLGLGAASIEELRGGDGKENLQLFVRVLDGTPGALLDVTLLNACAAILVSGIADDGAHGLALAKAAVDSGAARRLFARWIERAQELPRGS